MQNSYNFHTYVIRSTPPSLVKVRTSELASKGTAPAASQCDSAENESQNVRENREGAQKT